MGGVTAMPTGGGDDVKGCGFNHCFLNRERMDIHAI